MIGKTVGSGAMTGEPVSRFVEEDGQCSGSCGSVAGRDCHPASAFDAGIRHPDVYEATEVIFEHVKGPKRGVVAVALRTYRGNDYLDLRQWKPSKKGMFPTSKGVTLPLDCAVALADALVQCAIVTGHYGPSE